MSGSVNKVILIGNLGRDPEVRRLENGGVVANFSIATTETFFNKETGERREITDWHNIVAWRGLAEIVDKYLHKGMKVYIEGKLKTRSWLDKEGATRYTTEVLADNLTMLSRNESTNKNANYPTEGAYSKPQAMSDTPNSSTDYVEKQVDAQDDDLPF